MRERALLIKMESVSPTGD